jgi:hypothetical protein
MIVPLRAQQDFARVQGIPAIVGCQRHRAQRRLQRFRRPIESEDGGRLMTQHHGIGGFDQGSARKMFEGVPVPAGGGKDTTGMEGDFKRFRGRFACPLGMKNGSIKLAGGGKGAARVTVSGCPSGTLFQQPFIG